MSVTQLDVFGGETAHVEVTKRAAPFTPCQQEILRLLRNFGSITSTQAGKIVHSHRDGGCYRCRVNDNGHCQWASSDGNDAMKRLMERGLVRRHRPGVWIAR